MFAALAPYKLLIECLAFFALIGAVALGIHKFLAYEQQIGYDRAVAEYTAKQLEAEKYARATEQRLNKQLEEAQNAATARDKTISASVASAASTSASLRGTLNDLRNGLPDATAAAARATAVALTGVFGDCQDRYRWMAEKADRHASDVRTLKEAWPTYQTSPAATAPAK